MTTYNSVPSSIAPSISDLDGFTLNRDSYFPMNNSYGPADQDDFGFDPPIQKTAHAGNDQAYTHPELGGWPAFERGDDTKHSRSILPFHHDVERMVVQNLPNATNAISRYGQVTPPRTNSASSEENMKIEDTPRASGRKRTKTQSAHTAAAPGTKATPGRKRKHSKKNATNSEQGESPEDNKRKASLEKNRLAAAKCRINKKEKTEQLQRDSHEKGLHNAFLKEQVMRMKSEVQHMHAILLSHANCDGCKSPEEIQKHLAEIGQKFMAHQMLSDNFQDYSQMQLDDMPQSDMADDYFSSMSPDSPAMLHPPLPEFNRSGDFDVITPMQTG